MADDLYKYQRLRDLIPRDSPLHAVYGPLEHGQFTQDEVGRNPLMAIPMLAFIPAYTGLKAMGAFPRARSPASLDEMAEAYRGVGRGLIDAAGKLNF